ncbi:MAG: bifunctional oligoribonuclease/PAP phosphatase NrnA [Spirochaetaceae bacterium]|jgi:phosphoesterase RecJ-like protein|nr:bifunctional oligoribonuclease/PAP phosphatase NrnA [Spirochaetaceae bacterium]
MGKTFCPPAALLEFIERQGKFIIAGHDEPDADCIGSQLALASLLKRLGKDTLLRSAGPFRKPEVQPYKELFLDKVTETDRSGAALIIVDCQGPHRTGSIYQALAGLPLAIIDHHKHSEDAGSESAACAYIEAQAASATILVFSLFKAFGVELSADEARLLFLGLCTDSGFFRHIDRNGEETFRVAAELIGAGASPKETFAEINGGKTLASRLLLGTVLERTESYFDGKLLLTTEELAETEKYGIENRDSDTLYQLLMSVDGVEAAAVIRQHTDRECAMGLRSRNSVDVAKIAAVYGGGGHKNAAGAYVKGRIVELKSSVIGEFEKILTYTAS